MKLPLGIRILSSFYLLFFYLFLVSPLSATGTPSAANNATGESMKEANRILNAASNATANATSELMARADNVLNLASETASNATETAMNNTMNLLNNISGDVSLDTQNQTPNSVQSGLINYTSSLYQIQFQYPSSWELNEKKSRFDEGTDISVSSYSPSAYIYVQYLNTTAVEGIDFQMAVYEFFKSSIDSDYSKEYKVIEQPSFTTIGNQKAGTYLFTHKDKYEDYATRWASQHWIVYVGNHGYLLSFMTSTSQFDSPEMMQIRNQFLKSIRFLGDTNQESSIVPNLFD
jgi:hypothetical protein